MKTNITQRSIDAVAKIYDDCQKDDSDSAIATRIGLTLAFSILTDQPFEAADKMLKNRAKGLNK